MAEKNNDNPGITEISYVSFSNLKKNTFVSINNDFAICDNTQSDITISLGWHNQSLSTIQKKLAAGEFVVKKNNKNEDELYFVFFKKYLAMQPNNDVKDVLLLPSDAILPVLSVSMASRREDILRLAELIGQNIRTNKDMDLQQRLSELYNRKNNENINPINASTVFNNNINQNKENNNSINQENNNINLNNNINDGLNNNISLNYFNNNNINENSKNSQEHNTTEIKTNTVSLFGLNGCYKITKEEQSNHTCGCCFW